jgi:hypothetical protein
MGNNRRSRVTAIGLAVMLLGVSAGELGLLLGLVGVLIGTNTIAAAGVLRGGEEPTTPDGPAAPARLGALTAFLRRNLAVVGIILSSAAVSAGEAGPVLSFAMFALLLLGLCFISIQVLGLGEE